jgi:hypothetical protein
LQTPLGTFVFGDVPPVRQHNLVTAATFDSLTLNSPYPVCQANSEFDFARTHFDEFAFMTRAISAANWAGRMRTSA